MTTTVCDQSLSKSRSPTELLHQIKSDLQNWSICFTYPAELLNLPKLNFSLSSGSSMTTGSNIYLHQPIISLFPSHLQLPLVLILSYPNRHLNPTNSWAFISPHLSPWINSTMFCTKNPTNLPMPSLAVLSHAPKRILSTLHYTFQRSHTFLSSHCSIQNNAIIFNPNQLRYFYKNVATLPWCIVLLYSVQDPSVASASKICTQLKASNMS